MKEEKDKKDIVGIRRGTRPVDVGELWYSGMFAVLPKFAHKDNNNNYQFPLHVETV